MVTTNRKWAEANVVPSWDPYEVWRERILQPRLMQLRLQAQHAGSPARTKGTNVALAQGAAPIEASVNSK